MSELKEVLEFLGLDSEKIKTVEDFKGAFEPEFIRKKSINFQENPELINALFGKKAGELQSALKQAAKEYAIDLDGEGFKGKKIEEQFKLILDKQAELNLSTVTELKSKVGQTNDEAIKDWETKHNRLAQKLAEKESLLNETVNKYNDLESNSAKQFKDFQLNAHKKDLWSSIKFKAGITEIEKEGFESMMAKKYKLDLIEDKFEIRDSEGKPISNPKVTGTYRTPLEVLEDEALKAGVYMVNEKGGTPAPRGQQLESQQTQRTEPNRMAAPVHPNAQR